jgi:hypothetical protein
MKAGFMYDKAVMADAVWRPETGDMLFKKYLYIRYPHGIPLHIVQEFFT